MGAATEPHRLAYAARRTQVVSRRGELVVTIPPPGGAGFWLWWTFVLGTVVFLLCGAVWPAGTTVVWGATVSHPGGVASRMLPLAIAAFLVWILADGLGRRRTAITLSVRGRQLTCHVPAIRKIITKSYDLLLFRGAKVDYDEDGMPVSLVLLGWFDVEVRLFHAHLYRKADLERAAGALCEAITALHDRRQPVQR